MSSDLESHTPKIKKYWRLNHTKEHNEYNKNYRRTKYQTDNEFKIYICQYNKALYAENPEYKKKRHERYLKMKDKLAGEVPHAPTF